MSNRRKFTLLCAVATLAISLTDVGGVPGGEALNTEAFARGMERVSASGGGVLKVPDGVWLTGPIVFKSDADLPRHKDTRRHLPRLQLGWHHDGASGDAAQGLFAQGRRFQERKEGPDGHLLRGSGPGIRPALTRKMENVGSSEFSV